MYWLHRVPAIQLAIPPSFRSGNNTAFSLGLFSVVVAAVISLQRALSRHGKWVDAKFAPQAANVTCGSQEDEEDENESHRSRTRVGGMKVVRLKQMLDDMAEAHREEAEPTPAPISDADWVPVEFCDELFVGLTWEEQTLKEKRAFVGASTIIQEVRQSAVHRKLPHFYSVDKELSRIAEELLLISMSTQSFWRYGRDLPMRRMLSLPLMQLAATGGENAILPVTLGFVKHTKGVGPSYDDEDGIDALAALEAASPGEDAVLLGFALGADRETIESAFRRRSRHFHRMGQCTNIRGFHALTAARNRCLARLAMPSLPAYGGGGDLLAHYLLIGTDPGESRYREYSTGILDANQRGHLLDRMQILKWPTWDIPLTWGDEDDMICYGGPNPGGYTMKSRYLEISATNASTVASDPRESQMRTLL